MTPEQILEHSRAMLDDETGTDSKKLWKDIEMLEYINSSIEELCKRCHLIEDDSTVSETLATGTITLSGSSGSITMVTINGVNVIDTAVPYNGSLSQTATDLASEITSYTSTPNYSATASGAVVTISAATGTGSNPNGYVIAVTATTLTASTTAMLGGDIMTRLYLVEDQYSYGINSKILTIKRAKLVDQLNPLEKKTRWELDDIYSGWEDSSGVPMYYVPLIKQRKIMVIPIPDDAYTCNLVVSRLPLTELTLSNYKTTTLELPEEYHRNLFNYIKYLAYSKQDADTYDAKKSADYLNKFLLMDVDRINLLEIQREGNSTTVQPLGAFM